MDTRTFVLDMLDRDFAICRLDPRAPVPTWSDALPFCSISRSLDELSIICPEHVVPADVPASRGWKAFKVQGPFTLSEIGVLASLARPIADAGVSIMVVSTFDTDYVLVPGAKVEEAATALSSAGHAVHGIGAA